MITARKGYILGLPWTYVSKHRWSSDIITQLKTNMLAVSIKESLNAYCVSKPCVKLLGSFKESLNWAPKHRLAFTLEGSKVHLIFINNETTLGKEEDSNGV